MAITPDIVMFPEVLPMSHEGANIWTCAKEWIQIKANSTRIMTTYTFHTQGNKEINICCGGHPLLLPVLNLWYLENLEEGGKVPEEQTTVSCPFHFPEAMDQI